jgi:hydrogenase expression/formation protein HypE
MITLGHGAGGRLMQQLIEAHFLSKLKSVALTARLDSGIVDDLALTTDAYVVSPIFFPGGDIGRLAVCGTVNDLAMVGAKPIGLTAAFILEEGLEKAVLDRVVSSMAAAAEEAGVEVVSGDTKVVPRGACDKMFITTAGVGRVHDGFTPRPTEIRPGDRVVVSGSIADHGMAVMASRQELSISGDLESDVAPLNGMVEALRPLGRAVRALRDPTRGGVASAVNEMAEASGCELTLRETDIPVRSATVTACELFGIDPLHVANEGKLIAVVSKDATREALGLLRAHPFGRNAAVIGAVQKGKPRVVLETAIGARRILRAPQGEILPRIC